MTARKLPRVELDLSTLEALKNVAQSVLAKTVPNIPAMIDRLENEAVCSKRPAMRLQALSLYLRMPTEAANLLLRIAEAEAGMQAGSNHPGDVRILVVDQGAMSAASAQLNQEHLARLSAKVSGDSED